MTKTPAHKPHTKRNALKIGRLLLPILAVGMLAFAIMSSGGGGNASVPKQDAVPPVSTFEAQVAGIGVAEPSSENIMIGTDQPGVVSEVKVKVGAKVKQGDILFVIDPKETKARLAAADASYNAAKVAAADTRAQLARYRNVKDSRAISADELSRSRYAVELAAARAAEAKAQKEVLQATLDERTIMAPIDGTILRVDVRPGEFANAGMAGKPLLIMGNLEPMHVRVEIDESDALRVDPDAKAVASVRGYPERKVDLQFVRKEYYVEPKKSLTGDGSERVDTRTQEIIYAFDNDKIGVYVGQQMDVYIDASPRGKRKGD